jgi:hypothetical protein
MTTERPWHRDPHLWAAVGVGVVLRALPMVLWGWSGDDCTRDECIYRIAARPILEGEGLGLAPAGWLPAPGYPYLLAACATIFGAFEAVKWVQLALTPLLLGMIGRITERVADRRAARAAAWILAVHPTFVFFTGTMWTETVYTTLLLGSVLSLLWARDGRPLRAALPGALLGLTVLTRGVATWLAPIFVAALLVPEVLDGPRALLAAARLRAAHAGALVLALVLVVAPYSLAASSRWEGTVLSDATLGHVASLGNDDFPPITFDYGIGQLTGRLYARTLAHGRKSCPHRDGPVAYDHCETDRAVAWIRAHPGEFVARVPVRLAQLLNPHSFLTRHVRWGFWPGLPWALKELIVLAQALTTFVIVGGGTLAACARARGPYGVVAVGTVLYHLAVIAALYGLTRFRLPLEPLWVVYVASLLAEPSHVLGVLRGSPVRLACAVVSVPIVVGLMATYAWTGWPGL